MQVSTELFDYAKGDLNIRIRHLVRCFRPKNWQIRVSEQTNLLEDGSLIPVDVLVREFVVTEMHNGNKGHLNASIGRGNTGQHPRHFLAMSEAENHLIHDLSSPTVREIGVRIVSGGTRGMKSRE